MCKALGTLFSIFLVSSFASAQIPTSGNIFVGYSFEHANWSGLDSSSGGPSLNGWAASLEGKVLPHLGVVTDFSGHYGSQNFSILSPEGIYSLNATGHEWELLFGPRVSATVGKVTPFAEAMFGLAHIHNGGQFDNSNTSFGSAIGGGFDYHLIRLLGVRLEADYVQTRFFSTTQNNFRLSTGVVFRF